MENHNRNTHDKTDRIERLQPDASACSRADGKTRRGVRIVSDLPDRLPITTEEIGLLRAFLAEEISAILRGED